jgi:CubicO group peptidase (beta-lactamase class C family)
LRAVACLAVLAATSAHAAQAPLAAARDHRAAGAERSRAAPAGDDAPTGTSVEGFSVQRLERIDAFLDEATRAGAYLGAVALVARHGTIVHHKAYGRRDLARTQPLREDAIFRIYSMTKTVATVALLQLLEEGRVALDDPLSDFIPAFADAQVMSGGTADAPQLRKPARPVTLRHLLTHTAGFAVVAGEPATALLERADLRGAADLREFAARLARVPLAADPGTRFRYDGVQIEVASRVVEVVSGLSFEQFLQQRLFDPLAMRDTGFEVPPAQRGRVADLTMVGDDGALALDDSHSAHHPGERLNRYASGAGGLYSTAEDYRRFCQMLLDGGSGNGHSILGRKTVELMREDQLAAFERPMPGLPDGEGFGLGGSVLLSVAQRGRLGSAGQFGWSGAASTYYTIDPQEKLIAILLLQHLPHDGRRSLPRLQHRYYNLVYQALQP